MSRLGWETGWARSHGGVPVTTGAWALGHQRLSPSAAHRQATPSTAASETFTGAFGYQGCSVVGD